MTVQFQISNPKQNRSTWEQFTTWLNELGVALDYDPQEDSNAKIALVGDEVRKLEIRLQKLEGQRQAKLAPLDSNRCVEEVD